MTTRAAKPATVRQGIRGSPAGHRGERGVGRPCVHPVEELVPGVGTAHGAVATVGSAVCSATHRLGEF